MRRPNLFSNSSYLRPRTKPVGRAEVDLRAEFDTLIFGDKDHIKHGHPILIRNMRRDSDGYPTKCVCVGVEHTTEPDPSCSYCLGEGYLWDESWDFAYSLHLNADSGMARKWMHVIPGLQRTDYLVFFLRFDSNIKYEDKIVEVKLDIEGEPIIPYIRRAIYRPSTIPEMRSDYGRIEFIPVFCKEEDAILTDTPV